MKKHYLAISNALKSVANELDEQGKAKLEEIAAAVVALAENADADGKAEIEARIEQIKADLTKAQAESNEQVAEKIQKLQNRLATLKGGEQKVNAITPEVRKEIVNAIFNARGLAGVKNGIEHVMKANAITGLTYAEAIDYALQLKQEDNDEIFDALYKTNRSKWFYGELDPTDPANIAKQWKKTNTDPKEEQTLALDGKTILTAYLFKLQSLANEDVDDAREAGQETELLRDIRNELVKAVKGIAVRAAMVGDAYNASGSKVTTFETIGTKTVSDAFTTVVNPATAGSVSLADVRKAASKVKTAHKWLVISEDLKLSLATRVYAQGGTEFFFTDAELAEQLGVERIVAKDFIGDVQGLHAVVFDPNEYWVKIKNTIDTPFPDYRNNRQGMIYEMNMGGGIHGLQSSAVLREAE